MSIILASSVMVGFFSNRFLLEHDYLNPAVRYPITVGVSYLWLLVLTAIFVKFVLLDSQMEKELSSLGTADLERIEIPLEGIQDNPWWWPKVTEKDYQQHYPHHAGFPFDSRRVTFFAHVGLLSILMGIVSSIFIFSSGAYLILLAPEFLSECLLQLILVEALRKRMKKMKTGDWFDHLVKSTILTFVITAALAFGVGIAINKTCPEANSLKEAREMCL